MLPESANILDLVLINFFKNKSVDIVQPDICACGGLTEAKRISTLASTHGVSIIPHTWGSGIALHVATHFIANLECIPGRFITPDFLMEYDQTENAIRDQLTSGIKMEKDILKFQMDLDWDLKLILLH